MKISVALCTHNGEQFLEEQLRSILTQSTAPHEIVLSDDASTDDTVRLAESIAAEVSGDVRLRILKNSVALGVTKNFEQAVRECGGGLIALSDQDDVWLPDRLEIMAAQFAARPELLLLHSDAQLVDATSEPLADTVFGALEVSSWERESIHSGQAFDVFLRRNLAVGATTIFRRSLLDWALPFPESWVHDEWLAMVAALQNGVDFVDEPLIDYRQHGANQIGAARPTLAVRLGRLREPRRDRNRRLLARAEALSEFVGRHESSLPASSVSLVRRKVAHERYRSALPAIRAFRLFPIFRAAASGSYRLFGRMRYDMLRDLVQPDR